MLITSKHQSSSKESVAKSDVDIITGPPITLDTKVPHPTATSAESTSANTASASTSTTSTSTSTSTSNINISNNNNYTNNNVTTMKDHHLNTSLLFSSGGGNSSCSNSIEEVSYYNDQSNLSPLDIKQANGNPMAASNSQAAASNSQAAATNSGSCSASSSSGGSSNNNNNNNNLPASNQAPITVGMAAPNGSGGTTSSLISGGGGLIGARAKPLSGRQEQKLSIIVPPPSSLGTQLASSQTGNGSLPMAHGLNGGNSHTTAALDMCSRDYCNDFDDYDTRYDTAATEEDGQMVGPDCGKFAKSSHNHSPDDFEGPSSPKAKSAPATPCNVTPTAFHQHNSNNKSNLPNPANTLPVDTRRNISATCRMLPSSISLAHGHQSHNFNSTTTTAAASATVGGGSILNVDGNNNNNSQLQAAVNEQYLDNLIEEGESLFRHENFVGAIRNFSQCIELATQSGHFDYLKKNFRVYSQRAEGYFKLRKYGQAIEDSMAARELNPKWAQAHYILAQVPNNALLFEALVSAALNSSYPKLDEFEDNYNKLRERDLDKDTFVVVASLGQELLSKHHYQHAAIVLESALKLGTENKKFKSSVLSTTSHVFCAIGDYKKALAYMSCELEIETELNNVAGQLRVLSNIGFNYYKMGKFVKSLEAHRQQMNLAILNNLPEQAAQALNAIGHVHVARNDFDNALTSHEKAKMLREGRLVENGFDQFKELLAIGHVNSLLADYKTSEERYKEAIQMLNTSTCLKKEERQVGSLMVQFNLAYLAIKRQSFLEATQHYEAVISIARDMEPSQKGLLYEIRALNGLGHTCRVFQRFDEARTYFNRQLELAKKVNDLPSRSQALCNLGMIYQHFKNYTTAWKLFDENLQLVEDDPLLKAYAHSYRASMHFLWGEYTKAHDEYEKSLSVFKELEHCSAERKSIELNMDAVSERLGRSQISLASNTARAHRKALMTK